MWSLSQTEAPEEAALATQRVLNHCRIDIEQPGCDEATVAGWIAAATAQAEVRTGRQLITATWEMHLDCWPMGRIALPKPPLQSVTHVKYYAPGESALTTIEDRPGAIVITFVAGYGDDESSVPEGIKQGMLLRISGLNEVREDAQAVGVAADHLWSGYITYMPEMR